MKKNITILDSYVANPGDLSWEKFEALGNLTLYDRTTPSETFERMKDSEIIFTNKTIITNEHLDNCPKLEWIGVLATGYNVVDVAYARQKGITVTNIPAYSTASVAQHIFAFLLNITNFVSPYAQKVSNGEWATSKDFCMVDYNLMELADKTFGIIGFGTIGMTVAKLANSFGMKVMVYTPNPKREFECDTLTFVDLETLLRQSDVVSLHCLLSEETKGIINKGTLAKMKNTAILLNTARGPLIVEDDLAEALNSEVIYAAALDVLSSEPPNKNNPLFNARNCYITPHVAWRTVEARIRMLDIAYENIRSYLEDGVTKNAVN